MLREMLPFTTTTQTDCSKPDAACELEFFLLVLKMLESFQDEHPLTRSDELLCLKMLESFQDKHLLTRSENITSLATIFVSAKFPCFQEKY